MADSHSQGPIAEIRNEPSAFEQFLDRNQKLLVLAALLLAVAAAAWVVMQGVKEGADRSGGAALVAAEEPADFEALLAEHGASPAAGSAAVLLADRQWDQGLQNDAIETLEKEIAARPDHPASFPARARLGARLAEQGKTAEARAAFQALLSDARASYLAPYALAALADLARAEGEVDEAESLLTQAVEQHPANPLANTATQALRFVHFTLPEEVDPPAAPEEDALETGEPIDSGLGPALSPEEQAAQSMFGGSESLPVDASGAPSAEPEATGETASEGSAADEESPAKEDAGETPATPELPAEPGD